MTNERDKNETPTARPGHVDLAVAQAIVRELQAVGLRYRLNRCDWSLEDKVVTDYTVTAYLDDRGTGTAAVIDIPDVASVATAKASLQAELRPRAAEARQRKRVWDALENE